MQPISADPLLLQLIGHATNTVSGAGRITTSDDSQPGKSLCGLGALVTQ